MRKLIGKLIIILLLGVVSIFGNIGGCSSSTGGGNNAEPTPEPTATPGPTMEPSATPTPSLAPTPTATPTESPEPTGSPEPTPTESPAARIASCPSQPLNEDSGSSAYGPFEGDFQTTESGNLPATAIVSSTGTQATIDLSIQSFGNSTLKAQVINGVQCQIQSVIVSGNETVASGNCAIGDGGTTLVINNLTIAGSEIGSCTLGCTLEETPEPMPTPGATPEPPPAGAACDPQLDIQFEAFPATYQGVIGNNMVSAASLTSDGIINGDGVEISITGLPSPLPQTATIKANPSSACECEVWAVQSGNYDAKATGTCIVGADGMTLEFQNLVLDQIPIGSGVLNRVQ